MKIDKTWTLPADADRVYAMITDPAFSERVAVATGAVEHSVEVSPNDDADTVVVRRTMPTDEVPEALRRFVGESLPIVETQTWEAADGDGNRRAELKVDVTGMPVRYRGSITMTREDAQRTTLAITGDLKATVPLVGGQIEKAAGPAFASALDVEAEESTEWIASH